MDTVVYDLTLEEVNKTQKEIEGNLEKMARAFLRKEFDLDLTIPIEINGRLTKRLGYFQFNGTLLTSTKISINKDLIVEGIINHDISNTIDTLKHELIHYALFEQGLPFRDSDDLFTRTCDRLGVSLTGTARVKGIYHLYQCDNGHTLHSSRKFNENNYCCGKCKKPLHYLKRVYK